MKTWTCPICGKKHRSYRRFQTCYYGHVEKLDAAIRADRRGKP